MALRLIALVVVIVLLPVPALAVPEADYTCEGVVDMRYEGSSAVRVSCRKPAFTLQCDRANAGIGGRTLSCERFDQGLGEYKILRVRMGGFRVYDAAGRHMEGQWRQRLGGVKALLGSALKFGWEAVLWQWGMIESLWQE